MEKIFINKDNLTEKDIDEVAIRVKALIINANNEIILGYSNNTFQFIGGHAEDGEDLNEALKREIKEETGMEIETKGLKPFLLRESYIKNYLNSSKNRINKIYYFEVKTDIKINLNDTDYTDDEKRGNFVVRKIKISDAKKTIVNNNINSSYKDIAYEMLDALNIYFKKQKDIDSNLI